MSHAKDPIVMDAVQKLTEVEKRVNLDSFTLDAIKTALKAISILEVGNKNNYYTVQEVADMFGVREQTVYNWVHKGKIEFHRTTSPGGQTNYFIPKEQFEGEDTVKKKQMARLRKMVENQKKIKWAEKDVEDMFLKPNDSMEELGID
jgi:excisionase family DNA binding protein